ncbi:endonuclease/exonuclease/phosphatase family protein [Streptomyces zagrosensis]|uniref:Endonuclease/exonuclease/phosphatase domain-containing protein n=1 Tax=Streptomyces zagrosensis TaxID=1042984 RepID=A0A7W9QEB7_9ACTN|nr:endonuclease/exonuclease/phosphatase family protein [Streptomyces zagrosensis]MBB5938675.1 hypothetical protein [Streptomyces zagrosensis]
MQQLPDEIRVLTWNVARNGRPGRGRPDRSDLARSVLAQYRPHIVFRQEETGASEDGNRALRIEANRLGLTPCLASTHHDSPHATAVLIDTNIFEIQAEYEQRHAWHPIANPVVRLRGVGRELSLASIHLDPWSSIDRRREASHLLRLGQKGWSALIGGDTNCDPVPAEGEVPHTDWADPAIDPCLRQCRAIESDGQWVSDTRPDKILRTVFRELAHHAAARGQSTPDPYAPTSNWWSPVGLRTRVDRTYATDDVASTHISHEVIADDDVKTASDHGLLLDRFDTDRLHHVLTTRS